MPSVSASLAYLQGRIADAIGLDGAARTQVARMGLSSTPVFDRARTNPQGAISDSAVAVAEVLRWRAEGEGLGQDEFVALCMGERPASTS
jgi:hypothetical protein